MFSWTKLSSRLFQISFQRLLKPLKPRAALAEINTYAQIDTQNADQLSWKEQFQWLICYVFLTALYNIVRRAPERLKLSLMHQTF